MKTTKKDGEIFMEPDNFTTEKRWWYLECKDITFRSNESLDQVLRLWAQNGMPRVFVAGNVG